MLYVQGQKAGHCHAIARVRNPSFSHELNFIKKQIGISAIINPEMDRVKGISHLLASRCEQDRRLCRQARAAIKWPETEQQGLDGVAVHGVPARLKDDVLVSPWSVTAGCMLPNGNFVLKNEQ